MVSLLCQPAIALLAALLYLCQASATSAAEPSKLAYLVGVSKYERAGLRDLAYAEDDMTVLAKALEGAGFKVEVQLGSDTGDKRATRENLKQRLETQFANKIKLLKKDDLVLVALSGHGQQLSVEKSGKIVEDAYYCPVDALKTDPATLLSVSDLMELVGRNSGAENNLFVIDACRDNPAKGGKGIDGSRISLPSNMAALFGASSGTQSFESDELKHGLLTYYLLEGLTKAKDDDNEVNWDALVGYTKKQVSKNAPRLVNSKQIPNSISNIKGAPPVLTKVIAVEPKKVAEEVVTAKPPENKPADSFINRGPVRSVIKIMDTEKKTIASVHDLDAITWEKKTNSPIITIVGAPNAGKHIAILTDGTIVSFDDRTGDESSYNGLRDFDAAKFKALNVDETPFKSASGFLVLVEFQDGHTDKIDGNSLRNNR